jgi:two-component system, sensor histidine kinase and response regulator
MIKAAEMDRNEVNHKVLVVDDSVQHLYLLCNLLEINNLTAIYASSGEKALELAYDEIPDLILLDVSMPGMDGFEVCASLKRNSKTASIPVIFITARADKEYVIKGLETGAVDYIIKPFNSKELITRILTQIELKKNRDLITLQNQILEEKNKQLVDLNACKNKFFSIIAHDLKNPFGGSLQLTDLLLADYDYYNDSDKKQMLTIALEALKQGYNLLENLLEWSRSQIGSMRIVPSKVNLKSVTSDTIAQLSNLAKQKQITIKSDLQESFNVFADENMVKTITRNIISNAIKFTYPKGEIAINSRIEDNYVIYEVIDNGVGIPENEIGNLFKIDVKHTRLGTNDEAGSGLGLILCKEFAEKNLGSIQIQSELDKGTIITVALPIFP